MMAAEANLAGWWAGYAIGAVVVVVVAALALILISTARRIADIAADATKALEQARDRTEVLWQIATTNQVAKGLLQGAQTARSALGGNGAPAPAAGVPVTASRKGLGGTTSGLVTELGDSSEDREQI